MNEQELARLVSLQKVLSEQFQADATIANDPEKMKELDGLNRDLLVTRANATQTLLGVIQISIGLNLSLLHRETPAEGEKPVESTDEKPAETAPANEKEAAEESPKQE